MPLKADVEKWRQYWRVSRPSLTLQVYLECAAEKIAERIKPHFSGKKEPLLLDVGCGQGRLDVLLAEKTGAHMVALDIIEEALYTSKRLIEEKKPESRVSLVRASVYHMPFRDDVFDAAVSTGSESAAAYIGAPEEVSRVVTSQGPLFMDFTQMPNLYQPWRSFKNYRRYKEARRKRSRGEETKYYHYGKLGLKKRFEQELGLEIRRIWRMNNAPPVGNRTMRLRFEKTLGRILSCLLARTILVEFENIKKPSKSTI
jgi:ubiquinone/menaquinone biosynthesis C-methylase UbiE